VSLANLDDRERKVVRECLRAVVEGPFFLDWEFKTLLGLDREDVRHDLLSWPTLDETDESTVLAINNSMNNLLGYPLREDEKAWPNFISVNRKELAIIFDKWKGRPSRIPVTPRDYFDTMM
jgi:hypothetical protein